MCLPIPPSRISFVQLGKITQRYLVIEHMFSNEILEINNMIGDYILDSTTVFEIKGKKKNFSESISSLNVEEFSDFRLIFDSISELFQEEQVIEESLES